uniref:ATP synthase subunit gamma, mitochondrial n=1 Tax=Odontella aurita TaxID=265563 RepID=A0A7S4JIQ2_9STRA|mmetsp:Transcript_47058/g.142515  ORF Transcript_47058/g.142515 Transcript_47058/m.142515 type:complete len:305 (+) Transcript_47058:136-1050(+)|eukprot:CAMPEP_0113549388 /NCGR_PEP_ID=MMETSP0015_2-20120614/13406_1 /TAXON_ID=2838 /ORGANISM="Odontella" /LENGTH=304 /DNA_ID=CAMNT_0000450093 /DNA_START=338 /DNA_END=1252 /DNA_ORIENTATION=- /assembly_acc=CAM_ASM_000160
MALRLAAQRVAPRGFSKIIARGMATEKQIFNQIQSTKNIQKITSSMKMVSAAKLKGDENRLATAVPFNSWTTELCGEPKEMEDATYDELPQKCLLVPITSDKGLCGGVNSFITRGVRDCVRKMEGQGKECDVVVVGDKGRGQLKRMFGEKIKRSATDVVAPGTFNLAAALSAELVAADVADYDAVVIIYNSYVNPAVYKQKYKVIQPFNGEGENEPMMAYEFEPDIKSEIMVDLYEYLLTSQIFHSFMDGAAAEQSSRMAAMENASKNAGEMIHSLTLRYNRARQARITTELIEIISGASAIDN